MTVGRGVPSKTSSVKGISRKITEREAAPAGPCMAPEPKACHKDVRLLVYFTL